MTVGFTRYSRAVTRQFEFPERPSVPAHLGVLAKRAEDGWSIVYYQASAARPD